MAEPYYTTADDLRDELGIAEPALSDAAAAKIIERAEDLVDGLLGGWWPDETTGRKIIEGDVDPWQWSKLGRATLLLAADMYGNPSKYDGQQFHSVAGPDFSFSGPLSGIVPSAALTVLDASGLRRPAGHARAGARTRGIKPTFDRFLRATRHNGT